ncbi:hypothetical protein G3480_26595 [Thiorhodococcus mannitoliphagus]|uniref:Uncharacterized protein n=1 Tax=Thiorhodococcus mannitoliphagus TaxID=329406 RepID=A0A6P1E1Y5_9GAMM|nr:hypothetical protein [Thiorhodococcus mannitoliphagus]NEX23790.1 hypothetical protein [Thiorhodococcus mannitoliphagus]
MIDPEQFRHSIGLSDIAIERVVFEEGNVLKIYVNMAVKVTIRERLSEAVLATSYRLAALALREQSRDGYMRLFRIMGASWSRFLRATWMLAVLAQLHLLRGGEQPGGHRLGGERLKHGPFLWSSI